MFAAVATRNIKRYFHPPSIGSSYLLKPLGSELSRGFHISTAKHTDEEMVGSSHIWTRYFRESLTALEYAQVKASSSPAKFPTSSPTMMIASAGLRSHYVDISNTKHKIKNLI